MNYMGDSKWWNERFKGRKLKVMNHENILEEDLKYFKKGGKILDIACGDGRNSIYLASQGYIVHAIDFSGEALKRLNYFSNKERLNIKTKLIDLSKDDELNNLEKYDAIIINHYRLNPNLYKKLMSYINRGGVLWTNGFREVPQDNPNIKKEDILLEEDFISLSDYKLESKKLYEVNQRKFMRVIWRK